MDDLKSGAYMGNFAQTKATGKNRPSIGSIIGDDDLDAKIKGVKTAYKYMGIHSKMGRSKGLTSLVAAHGKSHAKGQSMTDKLQALDAAAGLENAQTQIGDLNATIVDQQNTITDLQQQVTDLTPAPEPVEPTYFDEESPLGDL